MSHPFQPSSGDACDHNAQSVARPPPAARGDGTAAGLAHLRCRLQMQPPPPNDHHLPRCSAQGAPNCLCSRCGSGLRGLAAGSARALHHLGIVGAQHLAGRRGRLRQHLPCLSKPLPPRPAQVA